MAKRRYVDQGSRLQELVARMHPRFRARFLQIVRTIQDNATLAGLIQLIQAGQLDRALLVAEQASMKLGGAFSEAYITAGQEAAAVIENSLQVDVHFDQVNHRAVQQMQQNQLRLVREFNAEQRLTSQNALIEGIRAGANPRAIARDFRQSIGLTQKQYAAVGNYRRLLERGSLEALDRKLRDARFDGTVRAAAAGDAPLNGIQIDRMVQRYYERSLKYRAEVIARTESLRAVHAGNDEMYQQALNSGVLDPNALVREWFPTRDNRTRESHSEMTGQQRGLNEAFLSGNGNSLMYPGDMSAPASDTAQCRCAITTRYAAAEPATV